MKFTKILIVTLILASIMSACAQADRGDALAEPLAAEQVSAAEKNTVDPPLGNDDEMAHPKGKDDRENTPQRNFDYEAIAAELGISAEDLQVAIESNREQGFLNFNEIAEALNIDETDLAEAFKNIDGGFGGGPRGDLSLQDINYSAVAEALNISEDDLRAAIENNQSDGGPMDLEQIASELSVPIEDLNIALGIPGSRMNRPEPGSND